MSLKLNERYPNRFNNPSPDYPQGSFKNRTAPGAKDGSYLEQDWANDKEGFFQSLLSKAGVLANGLIDKVGASQYFDALIKMRQSQTGVAFTSAGASPSLTLTPSPAITAYSANQRFRVKFAAASTSSDTLNVSDLGAKTLKQYDSTGAKVAAVFALNQLADVEYDGTDFVMLDPLPSGAVQATESVSGIAKIATQAAVGAGTDDVRIVTPLKLRNAYGLGNAPLITNLNTAGNGFFIAAGSATGAPAEVASGSYCTGETVMGDSVAVRTQKVLEVNTGRSFRRTYGAGNWGAWGPIIDASYQATESAIGVARVATDAGVSGGTDDTTIVTPRKLRLGFSISLNPNGYIVLPSWLGGFVLQWGFVASAGAANGNVNYPMAFPTACLGGVIQNQYTVNDGSSFTVRQPSLQASAWANSLTFFTWDSTQASRSLSLNWLAWGY